MIVDWPNTLVSDIARRRSVLVLGSGISRQAVNGTGQHPKMWKEFLNAARQRVPGTKSLRNRLGKLINDGDLLTACDAIKRNLGETLFHDLIREEFLTPGFFAAPIHDSIINLDSRIVATPNFDKIFESRINHLQNASVAVKPYYDNDIADYVRSTGRVVIKIHGTVDRPSDMIFTRSEYAKARSEYSSFYAILRSLIVTGTFLFLGCGLDDPDIRLLLEDYAFQHSFGRPHFFVLPYRQVLPFLRPTIEDSLNIKILEYNPQDQHRLLKEAIDELVALVDAERINLQSTTQW